jgi:hypothetical protein
MSVRRTAETESSLLPTPTASTYGSNHGGGMGKKGKVRHSLSSMANHGLWPTPRATDGPNGRASPSDYSAKRISQGRATLSEAVQHPELWATPTVCGNNNRKGSSPTSGDGLGTQVGGPLNPTWVEYLMGFPAEHTALEPSAMRSFRSARK